MEDDDIKKEQARWNKFAKKFLRGTVSEPWPTGEELFNDPKIQEKMKMVDGLMFGEKKKKESEC